MLLEKLTQAIVMSDEQNKESYGTRYKTFVYRFPKTARINIVRTSSGIRAQVRPLLGRYSN